MNDPLIYDQQGIDDRSLLQQMERAMQYPSARQKTLSISMFDGAEWYDGLGSDFSE